MLDTTFSALVRFSMLVFDNKAVGRHRAANEAA